MKSVINGLLDEDEPPYKLQNTHCVFHSVDEIDASIKAAEAARE